MDQKEQMYQSDDEQMKMKLDNLKSKYGTTAI